MCAKVCMCVHCFQIPILESSFVTSHSVMAHSKYCYLVILTDKVNMQSVTISAGLLRHEEDSVVLATVHVPPFHKNKESMHE